MEQTQKELSYQTEDHIATKNAAKLFETMTTEDKMELAKYMVMKMNEDDDLLQCTLSGMIDSVGKNNIEKTMDKLTKSQEYEPILDENMRKFTAFPIQYQNIWNRYKEQLACMWTVSEIDFSNDYDDFMTLSDNEQHFIEMILAFFAASDGIVNFNLSERFIKEIQNTEIQIAYQFQAMMENIHNETYSLMLNNIVKDAAKREYLFNAITNVESIKSMADWAFKWIESPKSFAHRVVAFAVIEGVFFSGAFAAIFWIKKYKNKNRESSKGKPFMDGLIKSNRFIARDEGSHAVLACEIYSILQNKLSVSEVNEIVREGVQIAKNFMTDALPVKLIGMNNQAMCDYIEYIGDILLVMLGYKKIYMKKNPFKFMATIGLSDKASFFETRPHEYQNAHVMNTGNKTNIVIKNDF